MRALTYIVNAAALIVFVAIVVTVIRALVIVIRGYRHDPIRKLVYLALGLAIYPLWWEAATRIRYFGGTFLDFWPIWLPLVVFGLGIAYTMFADRQHADRFNTFALAAYGALVGATVLTIRAANSWTRSAFDSSGQGASELYVTGTAGAISVVLGVLALITIALRRFGTRGKLIAIVAIALPLCWAFIIRTLLFETCEPYYEGVSLPMSSEDCDPDKPDPSYSRLIPKIVIDSSGRLFDFETLREFATPNELREYLSDCAKEMVQVPIDSEKPNGPSAPDDAIEIIADEHAPYSAIRVVLEQCMQPDVLIWKLRPVVRRPDSDCLCRTYGFLSGEEPDGYVVSIAKDATTNGGVALTLEGVEVADLDELVREVLTLDKWIAGESMPILWKVADDVPWGEFAVAFDRVGGEWPNQEIVIEPSAR